LEGRLADIVLPLAVPTCYTYRIKETDIPTLKVGMLVNVPLRNKVYSGIVLKIHNDFRENITYKPISSIVLPEPIVCEQQIELWNWISSYYMCKMGYVLKAAIPNALFNSSYKALFDTYIKLSMRDWISLFPKGKVTDRQKLLIDAISNSGSLKLSDAQDIVSASVINTLEKKGVIEKFLVERSRFRYSGESLASSPLSDVQAEAYNKIKGLFALDSKPVLLHGVTSSGKTEIYIKLIEDAISKGGQVLFLVPEIALTTQLTSRLEKIFGDTLLVYHSKLNDQERAEVFKEVLSGQRYKIVLGVRSSVFLPFKNLKLVIVDEQHDQSYKQQEPQPLYNAVHCAIVLASKYGANVVMGSATPSIEGYYNSLNSKWHLVELLQRYGNVELPETTVVDMRTQRRKNEVQSMFSWILRDKIVDAISRGEQVILFHNRRGYASSVHCEKCGWVPTCKSCSVSLIYHKSTNTLDCHYCGHKSAMVDKCPICGGEITTFGYGTEQVEDVIKEFLPSARVLRLDIDTTKGKYSYKDILEKFGNKEADILLGTQMVSKGLDFESVSLVGIVNADTITDYPDFRSTELAFQTLLQVSGRSGRSKKRGEVVLQTSHAEYPLINQIVNTDYTSFYNEQIDIRRLFSYPPFCRIVFISLKSKNIRAVQSAASLLVSKLSELLQNCVFGPEIPPVSKIAEYNIRRVMVKIPLTLSNSFAKGAIADAISNIENRYPVVSLFVDVDPF